MVLDTKMENNALLKLKLMGYIFLWEPNLLCFNIFCEFRM